MMTLSEADTKARFIEPKLRQNGWKEENLEREYRIKNDRFYVTGEEYKIINVPDKFADYVLKVNNVIVGIVEAKKLDLPAEKGLSQAKDYAKRLDVPITYATNGKKIIIHDRRTLRTEIVDEYTTPEELYQIYREWKDLENKNLSPLEQPSYISSNKKLRSYQEKAVKRVLEAILKGQPRVLLTMATGTGKTFVSFQIVWKLIRSGYLSRVLFITDRVFLRDQAYENFEAFGDARNKIRFGNFNRNRQIYFSTYQSLYSESLYDKIPKDFFDLIIIDECHRSRYGDWGEVLDHFETAYHIGMTATPKREDNIDVYDYFGESVYEYSLAHAIEDGYLVPFKIYKLHTNIDQKGVDISNAVEIIYDDDVDLDDIKRFYKPSAFERTLILPDRTQLLCERFLEILKNTNKSAKTIIFCVDTIHAENVRDTLNRLQENEEFATKIIYEDKDDLAVFRDSERKYPIVATTVDLLSTGIDIPHLQNIVFMRSLNSTVLFKQIIGRGSRLADNKGFFRIIDFTNATRLIDNWDVPNPPLNGDEPVPEEPFDKKVSGYVVDKLSEEPIFDAKVKIKIGRWHKEVYTNLNGYFILENIPSNNWINLYISHSDFKLLKRKLKPDVEDYLFELNIAKGKPYKIIVRGIEVIITDEIEIVLEGETITFVEYKKYAKDSILKEIHTLDELRSIWIDNKKRKEFLDKIQEENVDIEFIRKIGNFEDFDGFDIIAHVVFDIPLITRDERTNYFINHHIDEFERYGEDLREIVFALLEKYRKGGIENLTPRIFLLNDMKKKKALEIMKNKFGASTIPDFIEDVKKGIYTN